MLKLELAKVPKAIFAVHMRGLDLCENLGFAIIWPIEVHIGWNAVLLIPLSFSARTRIPLKRETR